MNIERLMIDAVDVRKLLGAASGDAALLYLYIHSGGSADSAADALRFSESRMTCAAATLRQLGLWPEERKNPIAPGERPSYSEKDVLQAMEKVPVIQNPGLLDVLEADAAAREAAL